MRSIRRGLRIPVVGAMLVTLIAMTTMVAAAAGGGQVVYNSIPNNLPGNVPSQPFQAQQTSEFGDSVLLERDGGKAKSVDVVMSSWACESGAWYTFDCASSMNATFRHPITLNLYEVMANGEPGHLLVTDTQTFAIPYRPSADARCTLGTWYSQADDACYNGFAHEITFKLNSKVALPEAVIWAVAFDTSGYGENPRGYTTPCATSLEGCPYDSLNVGTESFAGQPSKGADADENAAVLDSALAANYCDGGPGGSLQLDDPAQACWTGFRPLATIRTSGGGHGSDE